MTATTIPIHAAKQRTPAFAEHQMTGPWHQPRHHKRNCTQRKWESPWLIECYAAVGEVGREVLGQRIS